MDAQAIVCLSNKEKTILLKDDLKALALCSLAKRTEEKVSTIKSRSRLCNRDWYNGMKKGVDLVNLDMISRRKERAYALTSTV